MTVPTEHAEQVLQWGRRRETTEGCQTAVSGRPRKRFNGAVVVRRRKETSDEKNFAKPSLRFNGAVVVRRRKGRTKGRNKRRQGASMGPSS